MGATKSIRQVSKARRIGCQSSASLLRYKGGVRERERVLTLLTFDCHQGANIASQRCFPSLPSVRECAMYRCRGANVAYILPVEPVECASTVRQMEHLRRTANKQ